MTSKSASISRHISDLLEELFLYKAHRDVRKMGQHNRMSYFTSPTSLYCADDLL